MSVLVNKSSKIIVQGFTGKEGTFHSSQMIDYGTNIVGGVTPKKGGITHLNLPVFNTVIEAVERTNADTTIIFVPPAFAANAIIEAADAGIKVIITIILNFPKLYEVFEKQLIKIKFTNNSLHEVKEVIFRIIKDDSDVSYTQLVESLKERDLIKSLGDFRLDAIFSKLRSSDKKVEIDESRKVLEELIYMVNKN